MNRTPIPEVYTLIRLKLTFSAVKNYLFLSLVIIAYRIRILADIFADFVNKIVTPTRFLYHFTSRTDFCCQIIQYLNIYGEEKHPTCRSETSRKIMTRLEACGRARANPKLILFVMRRFSFAFRAGPFTRLFL